MEGSGIKTDVRNYELNFCFKVQPSEFKTEHNSIVQRHDI